MSAKKERELRKGIEVCQMLMERQDENEQEILRLRLLIQNSARERAATQELLLKTVRRMVALEEWRKDHIEQDMLRKERLRKEKENVDALLWIRRMHVQRVRRAFGWASGICWLLFLGFVGGLECGTISYGAAAAAMIVTACGGFVFACKAGVLTWE